MAVEYFDMDVKIQSRKYAFKCHRKDDKAYPVSSIAFHPVHGESSMSDIPSLKVVEQNRIEPAPKFLHTSYPLFFISLFFDIFYPRYFCHRRM